MVDSDDLVDSDDDQIPDWWEIKYGLDPHDATGDNGKDADLEPDGLTNFEEYLNGSDPKLDDTDTDGLLDAFEVINNLDPNNDDQDDNGIVDGQDDFDGDGSSNENEQDNGGNPNDNSDAGQERFVVTGDGEKGVEVEDSQTFSLPANGRAYLAAVYLHTDEYPTFTGDSSQFNDMLRWVVTPSVGAPVEGSISVNSLHNDLAQAEADGVELEGYSPVALQELGVITAPSDQESFNVTVEIGITNVSDGTLPSTALVALLPVDLKVDANRDGEITSSDETSESEPYRFWINNDSDTEEDSEDSTATVADSIDSSIGTQRDLEDFNRVWFNIGGMHDQLKSGEMQLGFKWTDIAEGSPSVKLYWSADAEGGRDYLTDEGAATAQLGGDYGTALGTISGSSTTFIDSKVFANIDSSNGWVYFLYEGVAEGSGKLTSVIKHNNTESDAASVDLKLLNVRKMYMRGKGVGDVEDPSTYITNQPPDPNITYVSDPWDNPFDQDPAEEERSIICVHGWRMTYNGAQKYGETFFKRLWHRGFKGRYGFFRWPTLSETEHPVTDGLFTYNESEYRAWKSGGALKSFVESFPSNYSKDVCAHSMGNVVIGSALQKGLSPRKVIFMQAAISAGCYDNSVSLEQQVFLNAEGVNRTPDLHTDGGYRNYLSNVGGELINFYNPEDFALKEWDKNNTLFKPDWPKGYRSPEIGNAGPARHAWPSDVPLLWRDVTDQHESMAFCARSRTLALGRTETPKKLSDHQNLDASFGFGDVHSAQFLWRAQKLTGFYNQFLKSLQIANIDEL